MRVLKGVEVARATNEYIAQEMKDYQGKTPHLAIVRVGNKPDDIFYQQGALKKMDKVGFEATVYEYPEDITNDDFITEFKKVNDDPEINGILLLKPLPKHIDEKAIEELIDPLKDLDGISPVNMAKVYSGDNTGFAPCTAEAVIEMLDFAEIDLTGKSAVVIGRSLVIGKPVAMMLMKKNATVTICHTRTKDMPAVASKAEVLIAAAGVKRMVTADYVADDAVVIDVGINQDEDGSYCGDVDYDAVAEKTSLITPVPGGVGSVTTSVLAKHLLKAAKMQQI